jgi:hypothetical protein
MSEPIRPTDYARRTSELAGLPVGITTYRLGDRWVCAVDNVSPGPVVARAVAGSKERAEEEALTTAGSRMSATTRRRDALRDLHEQVERLDDLIESRRNPT